MNKPPLPVLALTPGEPAGIGPELALKLATRDLDCCLLAIADPDVLAARAQAIGLDIELKVDCRDPHQAGSLCVLPIAEQCDAVTAGELNPDNSAYVLATIARAADGCKTGEFDAMVTGPVHKGIINDAGIPFSGHTEFIADRTNSSQPVMVLANKTMRVALVTTHLPLKDVAKTISAERIRSVLAVLHHDLQHKFGIAKPVISVCGLNPHAGEGGHLGREECDIIEPLLDQLRDSGMQLIGPLPADTAFTPGQLQRCDATLTMYHDQGLPVIKSQGFGEIVNITLGLPIIRTSVDHGTALDLAGSGKASEDSLIAAVNQALTMISIRSKHDNDT